uniref:G-protein coupled receptors family 1 profile domain-containing protein n=1 Tax=Globodera rostochiensis TaxID=31243 RepID=A0A914HGY4_GLORO
MDPLHQCSTDVFQLPDQSPFYELLKTIKEFYQPIHTYLSIVLCAVGTLCNVCNIVVLTRKKMRSPVNLILCAMACCDTVVLSSNMVYTTHYTFVAFNNCVPKNWSYGWCVFLISHAHLSLVGHSSSIWLSVMLALIRYITLRRRGKSGGVQIGLQHSYIAIASVVVFVSLMNGPNFLTYKISEQTLDMTCGDLVAEQFKNDTAYVPGVADVALELFPCLLLTLLVSLLMRILREVRDNRQRLFLAGRGAAAAVTVEAQSSQQIQPDTSSNATAVFVFSTHLDQHERASHIQKQRHQRGSSPSPSALSSISVVSRQNRHSSNTNPPGAFPLPPTAHCPVAHSRLLTANCGNGRAPALTIATPSPVPTANSPVGAFLSNSGGTTSRRPKSGSGGGSRTDRTTRMLLAIVCVFLITELPQGVMAVLNGMFSEEFHYNIYNRVGDILDLLSLCNACTSFIIYCTMSAQFRNEFRRVFLPAYGRMKCWQRFVVRLDPNGRRRGKRRRRNEISEGKSLLERCANCKSSAQYDANLRRASPEALMEGSLTSTSIPPAAAARISPLMGLGHCSGGTSADDLLAEGLLLRTQRTDETSPEGSSTHLNLNTERLTD